MRASSTHSRAISARLSRTRAIRRRREPVAAGPQHLVDRVQQPIAVLQHDAVELATFVLVEVSRLERLQIEANRRHGRLQLVGDRVDERVVLLVAADLADQKDGVEHEAGDDDQEEDQAEEGQDAFLPVDHQPADVQRDSNGDEADAENDEENDRTAAAGDH